MKDEIASSHTLSEKGQNGQHSPSVEHSEKSKEARDVYDLEGRQGDSLAAVFENPLSGVPRGRLFEDVAEFCKKFGLEDHIDLFQKGALISQSPTTALDLPELNDDEKNFIRREKTHKWSQPWQLYFMAGELWRPRLVGFC